MQYVIGIDEAGRGALAGPVAVGAVLIPENLSWQDFEGLKDSKKLSEKKREAWFTCIKQNASDLKRTTSDVVRTENRTESQKSDQKLPKNPLHKPCRTSDVVRGELELAFECVWAVHMVDAQLIDEGGIVPACLMAAELALLKLGADPKSTHVRCDAGLHVPKEWRQEAIVRGDEQEPAIALASIVAKVSRDQHMKEIADSHTQYGLEQHKGYGTALHRAAIKKHGISVVHRKTFTSHLT